MPFLTENVVQVCERLDLDTRVAEGRRNCVPYVALAASIVHDFKVIDLSEYLLCAAGA